MSLLWFAESGRRPSWLSHLGGGGNQRQKRPRWVPVDEKRAVTSGGAASHPPDAPLGLTCQSCQYDAGKYALPHA